VRPNGLQLPSHSENAKVHSVNGSLRSTTVLVAIESAQLREALAAMLGALDGYRVVAEADSDEAAIEAARSKRPDLALIDSELSGCGGWWAIRQIRAEHLAGVVVALGRRADCVQSKLTSADAYVQIGTSPGDLLEALASALGPLAAVSSAVQTEADLLANSHAVL
jgi:two-component system response regulator DesR